MGLIRKLFGRQPRDISEDASVNKPPISSGGTEDHRPFEMVQSAQDAFAQGDRARAESLFHQGLDQYRRSGEHDGVGFALGRLGDFYQKTERLAEAIRTYEEAVALRTDIPVVYSGLMSLYADAGDEEALFRTADAFMRNVPRNANEVPGLLVRHAVGRSKVGDDASAERWLLRAEGWATRVGNESARFAAWGQRGLVIERAGDLTRAIGIYEAAVASGSTDRQTFTRLLMAYERAKRWEDVLTLAHRALGIQHDAAWEQDLCKRIARVEARQSPCSKAKTSTTIPAFSVRHGTDRLVLVSQTTVKHGASRVAVALDGKSFLVSAGSAKADNLSMIDVASNAVVWTTTVSGSSAEVVALNSGLFLVASGSGRIGDGRTDLTFLDTGGRTQATITLPDKLSEVRSVGELVVAGCRDGHLYAFDTRGRERWRFRVPPRDDLGFNTPGGLPCPYFITVSPDAHRVMFSSWDTVFMVDARGKLQWNWRVTTERQKIHFTVPLAKQVSAEQYYSVLGLTTTASSDDVRRAFRCSALATHPDHHPDDPQASAKFRAAVQAYEAIMSGAATPTGGGTLTVEVMISGMMTTIYGLAVAPNGEFSLVSASDGSLTRLDSRGRPTRHLVASEGAGYFAATPKLDRVVYAHWQGFNFYDANGLIDTRPAESLHQMRMAPDGRHVAAWTKKELQFFTTDGHPLAEIEFARNVSDVAFASPTELVVAAGKLIRLSIQ